MKEQQKNQPLLMRKFGGGFKGGDSSFFSLFRYADRLDKTLMTVGTLAAIGAGVASPLFMIFFSTISQIFIPGNEDNAVEQGRDLFIKLLLVGIFTWICHATSMWAWNKSGSRQTIRLKKIYYSALLRQEMSWFDSKETSKITSEISQNTLAIEAAIGEKLSFAVTALVTSVYGFVFSMVKCWKMSLYLATFLPFMLVGGFLMMKSLTMRAQTSKISYQNASGIAQTSFSSIKTIKTLVSQKNQVKKFSQALSSSQPKLTKHILYSSLASAFMNLIMMGLYSFGFFIGKEIEIGEPGLYATSDIIATFFCFMVAGQNIGQISPVFKNVADAKVAAGKIYELINREQDLKENEQGIILDQIHTIQLNQIQFSYPNSKSPSTSTSTSLSPSTPILSNLSLKLTKGTITAIVGASGSGKSTIAQLLLNFYRPTQGQILINGHEISQLNIFQYRKKIGYVSQEPVLFSMSIKENIGIARPGITDQEVRGVLGRAYALDFVEKLEHGIDTYVGSRGTQLSGGQKQRISIARTLSQTPSTIILDQATSALDQHSQREIQKTITNLAKQNMIVIVIAHRLSTIRNADNIVVVQAGRVVEMGSHQELVGRTGMYYRLVEKQMQGDGDIASPNKVRANKQQHMQQQQQQNDQNQEKPKLPISSSNPSQPSQSPRTRLQTYLNLSKLSKKNWPYFLLGSLFALINGLVYPFFNASFSTLMGLMANPQENNQLINWFCLAFVGIAVLASLSNFGHTFMFGVFGEKLVYLLRVGVFEKMLKFQCSYFDQKQNTPGAISIKLSQNSYQLHNVLTGITSVLCLNLSIIVASLAFAFYYSWQLTIIGLVFSPLLAAKGAITATVLSRITKKSDEVEKNMGAFISDTIGNIRTVKAFGGYRQFQDIFGGNLDKMEEIVSRKFLRMGVLQGFSRSIAVLVYAVLFWVAAALFAHHHFQQPRYALVAIFCIVFSATTVGSNSQLMPDLAKAQNSANSILNILQTIDQYQQSKRTQQSSLKKYKIKGAISFKNVCFKYPTRQQQILKDFCLEIKQGEKIAIVGHSGSGKSTIFHILARLYPITSGEVLIDGKPIQSYGLRSLRRQLGILSQQPTIFKGTVRSNILHQYQQKQKYNKRFQKYCKISCVDDIIDSWQQKYDKEVGQRGCLISGGQKQRIALARCLIKCPKILLMDEPTSALDIQTQSKLFSNLSKIIHNKTVLFSAHRMCTVKYAEKIVVMKAGRIVQEGTFGELGDRNGEFYRLVCGDGQQGEEGVAGQVHGGK